jgi:hypothetical protein
MKHFIFTIAITCLYNSSINAQEYVPFPDSTALWVYKQAAGEAPDDFFYYAYYQNGDTVIGDKTYHKIWGKQLNGSFYYIAAIREENKKIYCVMSSYKAATCVDNDVEALLYDFTANVGDTVIPNCYTDVVIGKGETEIFGKKREVFEIYKDRSYHYNWYTGVGGSQELFDPIIYLFEYASWLICFYDGVDDPDKMFKECLKPDSVPVIKQETVSLYPNPFNENLTFSVSHSPPNRGYAVYLYNMQGTLVLHEQLTGTNVIPTKNLARGSYLYRVTTGGEVVDRGVVVRE